MMTRFLLNVVSACLAVALTGRAAESQEPRPDELRAKAEQLQRQAEMLFRQAEERERQHQSGQPPQGPGPIEELHRRSGELKEKIEILRREGRHEDANRLEQEIQEIKRLIEERQRQQPPGQPPQGPPPIEEMHRRIGELKEKIEILRREGRHEDANRLEQEIQEIKRLIEERQRQQPPGPGPDQRARILHEAADRMVEAGKLLHEAGVHDLAEKLIGQAEQVRRQAQPPEPPPGGPGLPGDLQQQLDQLRRDVDQLRGQVNELFNRLR